MTGMRNSAMAIFALLAVLSAGAEAARSVPVEDQTNAILNIGSKPLGAPEIKRAILRAAVSRGWQPINDAAGKVRLQLDEKKKGAYRLVIDIVYNAKNYTIKYVSSDGLKYSESDRTIHSSYARWTNLLIQSINRELTSGST